MGLGLQLSESVFNRIKSFAQESGIVILYCVERGSAQLIRQVFNSVVGVNDITVSIESENVLMTVLGKLLGVGKKFVLILDYQNGSRESMSLIRKLSEQNIKFAVLAPESSQRVFVNIWESGGSHIIVRGCHTHESISNKLADLILSDNPEEKDLDEIEDLIHNCEFEKAIALSTSKLKTYLANREMLSKFPISRAMFCLGLANEGLGEMTKAESFYAKAIAANKLFLGETELTNLPNIKALNKMAELKLAEENLDEALGYLLKLDKFNPENSARRMDLAKIYCKKFQEDKACGKIAIEYFESAIRLTRKYYPDLVATRMMEASAYLDPVDPDKAISFMSDIYNTIEEIDDVVYLNNIAARLIKDGSVKKAFEYLKRAVEVNPEDPTLNFNMAKAYFKTKRYVDSEKWAFKGISLNPNFLDDDPSLSIMLANLYYLLRDKEQSLKYSKIASKLYPHNEEISKLLEKLNN